MQNLKFRQVNLDEPDARTPRTAASVPANDEGKIPRARPIRCVCECLLGLWVLLLVTSVAAQVSAKNSPWKLLLASDIHFNPMADPALVADLAAADASQWEAILQRSKLAAFSPYGQDSNWWLMRSAFDAMARTEPHPALVIFTGDLLAHSFPKTYKGITHDSDPEHYRAYVLKTFDFIALEFRNRFPDAKVLLTPGNNDEECGDYSIAENGVFLSDTANRAGDLAREGGQFTATWKSLGSYSIEHPTLRGVRIISLNTIFWSNKYHASSFPKGCATVDSTAGSALLAWLEAQLAEAEKAHQKVWLMFHIPPGIDGWASTHPSGGGVSGAPANSCGDSIVPMWVPGWTASLEKLLEHYHNTVLASFAGHTHVDSFMLAGAGEGKQFVLIDPAVSPVYDQNPGFRIVNFRGDGTLSDQTTYYLTNLTKAGGSTGGRWKKEYTFSRQWKTRQLDAASLTKIYKQVASKSGARDRWLKLYMVSSTDAPIPAAGVKGLYCAMNALDPKSYATCACGLPNQP
jgi:sphingomyelin phosphodiesterase acid-like 3